jgi:hypothetical protein
MYGRFEASIQVFGQKSIREFAVFLMQDPTEFAKIKAEAVKLDQGAWPVEIKTILRLWYFQVRNCVRGLNYWSSRAMPGMIR